jgi:hypothetical protein
MWLHAQNSRIDVFDPKGSSPHTDVSCLSEHGDLSVKHEG